MKQGRAYQLLSWSVAAAVAIALIAEWAALYRLHADSIVVQIDRRSIIAKSWVELIGFGALGILALGVLWRAWRRSAPILVRENLEAAAALTRHSSIKAAGAAAREIALGGGMRECEDIQQWFAHQLIMWGFLGLFATTSLDTLMNPTAAPLPLLHPVRLLGNLTRLAFMTGLTLAIARRALLARVRAASQLRDWTFLVSL